MVDKLNEIERGYLAGFFDAEGNVTIDGSNYTIRAQIRNTNLEILKLYQSKFGGYIIKDKLSKLKSGEGYRKQGWLWLVKGDSAIKFFNIISQYSVVKKKQVELGIKYRNEIKLEYRSKQLSQVEVEKRIWFINEIKRLNNEDYNEQVIKDYENELKRLKIPKDIREGKQTTLFSSEETYKSNDIDIEVSEIEQDINHFMSVIPEKVFKSYTTGFIDGEGSITILEDYTLLVEIGNTNFQVLRMIQYVFGGNINKKKKEENRKNQWILMFFNVNAYQFLKKIELYFIVKKNEAMIAIKYWNEINHNVNRTLGLSSEERAKRELFREELSYLKHRNINDNLFESKQEKSYSVSNDDRFQEKLMF